MFLSAGVEQFREHLVAGGDDAAGGGETGRGDDHVHELLGEIDVALLQGPADDLPGGEVHRLGDDGRAAVGAGTVETTALVVQTLVVVERGQGDLAEGPR